MDFLSNPELETFNPAWPGTPFDRGRFRFFAGDIPIGFNQVVRYLLRDNPQAAEKRRDEYAPPTLRDDIHQSGDWVCWFGHACFLIQLDGVRYLTDPVWHSLGFLKRRVAAPYTVEEIGRVDYLLLSHDHRDHCDERTIKELSQKLDFRVLAPLHLGEVIEPWLKRDQIITEAGWYQRYDTRDAEPRISFTPTQHWCRRLLTDTNRRLWGSFVIEGKSRKIWFGGDSAVSPHFAQIAEFFPDIDLAMIGIGAYKPAWFMQGAHTSPEQAWAGFTASGASQLYPMHFGTYDLSQEPAGEPIRLLTDCAKTAEREGDLVTPVVGEVVTI